MSVRGHRRLGAAQGRPPLPAAARGQYTDDINRPGQLYAVLPALAARARAHPRASTPRRRRRRRAWSRVFTGADIAADGVGGLPCGWLIHSKDGKPMAEPPHPVLAVGKVRHVGDPVAVVIAETRPAGQGRRRADRRRLRGPAGRSRPCSDAIAPGAAAGARRCARQRLLRLAHRRQGRGRRGLRRARRTSSKLDLVNNRLIPNAMEPRAAIGDFDRVDRRLHALHHQPEPARRSAC